MRKIVKVLLVTIAEVEQIAYDLAKELMSWNGPILKFDTRFPGVLESSLTIPFQKFGDKFLYKTFLDRAAILFYLMIKNHPFRNGNKRIAMTTLFYFLHKNERWMKVDNQELYNFARWVADSNAKLKDAAIEGIKTFLKAYIINLPDNHDKSPGDLLK